MSACSQCGTVAKSTDKFCNVCGTPLPQQGAPAGAPAPPPYAAPPQAYAPPSPGGGAPGARCQLGHDIAPGASYCPQGHPIALDQMQFASGGYGGASGGYGQGAPAYAPTPLPGAAYGAPPQPGFAPAGPPQQGYAPAPQPPYAPVPAPGFGPQGGQSGHGGFAPAQAGGFGAPVAPGPYPGAPPMAQHAPAPAASLRPVATRLRRVSCAASWWPTGPTR